MWRSVRSIALGGIHVAALTLTFSVANSWGNEKSAESTESDSTEISWRLQACEFENIALREEVENGRRSLNAWGDNAAEANAEAEVFRRQYETLKLRMEALGLTTVGDGNDPLEQRLLKSVRDLDLARQQKDALREQLLALAESVLRYLKTSSREGDSQTRSHVEAELRSTNEVLGNPIKITTGVTAVPTTLRAGLVLGCKEDLSLLIANFGSSQGLAANVQSRKL